MAYSTPSPEFTASTVQDILRHRTFFGVATLLFIASAAVTLVECARMSAMAEMPMPGGWTMSMTWMRMPGQTWTDVTASFFGMWVVMMVAMMLPSLSLMLWRYRRALAASPALLQLGRLTLLVGVAYFFVWTLFGALIFLLGIAFATLVLDYPALSKVVPTAAGVTAVLAGVLQLTKWKLHYLTCCRRSTVTGATLSADFPTAWRHGLRLGIHCCYCCAAPMAVLLVAGVMNTTAMMVVTAAISAERLAPAGERIAKITGVITIGVGLFMAVRG